MSHSRDAEYTEYAAARLSSLRLLGTNPANWTTNPIG